MYNNIKKEYRDNIAKLSEFEKDIIVNKSTERPYTGGLLETKSDGTFICKLCRNPLYRSNDKFNSNCGWPSFDDEIDEAIERVVDADGRRVEIVCATCHGHLGHLFEGERMTSKNTRHCVNSASIEFVPMEKDEKKKLKKAYVAGGCFWGVEHYMQEVDGVIEAISGFMGGHAANPSYHDVVRGDTGHLETVEVIYDSSKVTYKEIIKTFFNTHNPEQTNGQGPDIGSQYLSAVFTSEAKEIEIVKSLINNLKDRGYNIATKIEQLAPFYPADEAHQDYYAKRASLPYCHTFINRCEG